MLTNLKTFPAIVIRCLDSYDLDGVPDQKVWISELVKQGKSPLKALNGVDDKKAQAIVAAWGSSGFLRSLRGSISVEFGCSGGTRAGNWQMIIPLGLQKGNTSSL